MMDINLYRSPLLIRMLLKWKYIKDKIYAILAAMLRK